MINQIAKRDGQPNLVDRVHIRKASHLIPQLADPELLSVSAPGRADVRDLMAAYRDLLLQLQTACITSASGPCRPGKWAITLACLPRPAGP